MSKGTNQKQKYLYLVKILSEETDAEQGMTISEIIEALNKYDVKAERRTLYKDLEELRQFGFDVVMAKEGNNALYSMVSREFELAELKLLVDAIVSSKFITEKKSSELIKKIETLCSRNEAQQLRRQVLIPGRVKTMNESIYYNVDLLHNAINRKRKIEFKYFMWNTDKKEELKRNGDSYFANPWHLRWDDENYYLIAYDSELEKIKHYRVDKMKEIKILDEKCVELNKNYFDEAAYSKRIFGMFGGEEIDITFECKNEMIGVMIDRFGKDIPVIKQKNGYFITQADVAVSPQFFGWICSLAGNVRIIEPESVVREMKSFIENIIKGYEQTL